MKVKKFKNLWTMGLILFGAVLIALYVAKAVFPEFYVGVAQTDFIVKFGEFLDTHQWAYYIFNGLLCFVVGYFYCCACARKSKLNWKELILVLLYVATSILLPKVIPEYYTQIGMIAVLVLSTFICAMNKCNDIKYLYSTVTCFAIHYLSQPLSLIIRDVPNMVTNFNSATFIVLMLDVYIWVFFLYCFFNYKQRKESIK